MNNPPQNPPPSTTRTRGEVELQTIIKDMERYIDDVRSKLTGSIKETERTQKALEYQHHMSDVWEKKATMARGAKREDLVREALEHKRRHEHYATEIKQELQRLKSTAGGYQEQMNTFEMKIEAAKVRIEVLWARRKHALMQKSVEAPAARLARSIDQFDRLMGQIEAELEIEQDLRAPNMPKPAPDNPEWEKAASVQLKQLKGLKPLHFDTNDP